MHLAAYVGSYVNLFLTFVHVCYYVQLVTYIVYLDPTIFSVCLFHFHSTSTNVAASHSDSQHLPHHCDLCFGHLCARNCSCNNGGCAVFVRLEEAWKEASGPDHDNTKGIGGSL